MKTYPITHYEYIKKNFQKFFGVSEDDFYITMNRNDFDYISFEETFHKAKMFMITASIIGDNKMNILLKMSFHMLSMKHYGDKIYYLDSDVCNLINDTRLTIDAEFIESPFEEIHLYTENSAITIKDHDSEVDVKGIYIRFGRESDGIKRLRFFATGSDEVITKSEALYCASDFEIPDSGSIEESCEKQIKNYEKIFGDSGTVAKIFRFCVNSLIYISCRNAHFEHIFPQSFNEILKNKKSPGKLKKLKRKMSVSAQKDFIYVSHNWGKGEDKGIYNGSRKINKEFLVSGHWKGQWKGSESTGNRRKEVIRVKSYLKGIGNERKNKKYIVKV